MNSIQTAQANYEALRDAMLEQAAMDAAWETVKESQKADFIYEVMGKRLSDQLGLDALQSIFNSDDSDVFDENALEVADDPDNCRFHAARLAALVKKHARHCLETDAVIFNRELAAYRKAGGDEYELLDMEIRRGS